VLALDKVRTSDRAAATRELGLALVDQGRFAEAVAPLEEALSLLGELRRATTPERADVLVGLGRARLGLGHAARALPHLVEADTFWRGFGPDTPWAGEAAFWLGRCLRALGREAEGQRAMARGARLLAHSPLPIDARMLRASGATPG
jgi:tetratricopeptide (TPR) repeat protein